MTAKRSVRQNSRKGHLERIYVLAGTNGAGKSSIAGAMFLHLGIEYFNPDEAARQILAANPGITPDEANAAAWNEGKSLLVQALSEELNASVEGAGSTTEKRKRDSKGTEPDSSFYVGNVERILGKEELNLEIDSPPDTRANL